MNITAARLTIPVTARVPGPHQGQPVYALGAPLSQATAAMVLVHGRGATAQDILTLAPVLEHPAFAFIAPQAAAYSWYPYSFLSPIARNEPGITSGLAVLRDLLAYLETRGISAARTLLVGFSQGACLALEFAARHAQRYGGVAGLSGGLIGPDGASRDDAGTLAGAPVFLGCSDVDPHIPKARVLYSADVLTGLGGRVSTRLYAGMGHTINEDEVEALRGLMADALTPGFENER